MMMMLMIVNYRRFKRYLLYASDEVDNNGRKEFLILVSLLYIYYIYIIYMHVCMVTMLLPFRKSSSQYESYHRVHTYIHTNIHIISVAEKIYEMQKGKTDERILAVNIFL